jgi:flavin reductase (DIM6/NTAB) family NADH-FMN oxidoreductase RutF
LQVVRTNPGVVGGGNLVLGEVVHVHVDDALVDDRWHVDADTLRAIGRMGGSQYCRTRDRFDMPRGREALVGRD